jgi:hypothetical protein
MTEDNPYHLDYRWLVGVLIVVIFALVGSWAAGLQSRVKVIEEARIVNEQRLTNLEVLMGKVLPILQEDINDIKKTLRVK